jgi:hypothetical protein
MVGYSKITAASPEPVLTEAGETFHRLLFLIPNFKKNLKILTKYYEYQIKSLKFVI